MIVFFLILFVFFSGAVFSQDGEYTSPVKIPVFLSGSFAELRNNHFHSGIDIKTQGIAGIPVYAVAEGFISRIVVSPTGFGLAIYMDHPSGTTSVYGHLDSFREDIARYVKNIQYERKSYNIDVRVPKNLFHVAQGEIIAKSGNSGSSGGPHLHFELRDTRSEEPVNPLHFSFPVKDGIPPRIYSVMIVPLNEYGHVDFHGGKKTFPVVSANGKYSLENNRVIPVYGLVGFAVQTNDFFDGSNNRCGIYSIRMLWDGELYYSFQLDRFSFEESRYVNSHIDYEEFMLSNNRYHKAWIDPGNKLGIYDYVRNKGALRAADGNIHQVRFEVSDLAGNTSILDFNVESKSRRAEREKEPFIQLMKYDKANQFEENNIRIGFPENCFYTDVKFEWKSLPQTDKLISDIHVVHKSTVPLHNGARLSVKTGRIDDHLHDKALLVSVDTLTGKFSSAGGVYENGWVTGLMRAFGNYAAALDTVPPRIVPLSIREKSAVTESSRIRFRISDDLSGIGDYTGMIDGQWALFEYDAKSGLITHYFDGTRFDLGKRHMFQLTVTDNRGNRSIYEASFWK